MQCSVSNQENQAIDYLFGIVVYHWYYKEMNFRSPSNNLLRPLTYTYLDCLLGVKMRGHKMAEIWEWLLMGSTADQYQDRSAGLLLWFVLVCRVMPRSLMFQDKLQLYKAKSSIFNSGFFILLYVYWKMEFNLFRFSTIIYLLASYCKWFYWTKVD